MDKITKNKIINAVNHLLQQKRSIDITMTDISDELNITHAALYKHFKNKKELWESVTTKWFEENILGDIHVDLSKNDKLHNLHDWIKQFVDAKRAVYFDNPEMFKLNTKYVDENPLVLHAVLTHAYPEINKIMGFEDDTEFIKAENIMSAFAIFTLPDFVITWNDEDWDRRFDDMWNLIEPGLKKYDK